VLVFLACSTSRAPETVAPPVVDISKGRAVYDKLEVGPPHAKLAYWVNEPKEGTPIHGTVLMLHGFLADHLQIENAAEALRNAGYRTIMVDLRGFGKSTGTNITFGYLDKVDLTQLIDYLLAHDLCSRTLGVYGTSYGAASAILYAAADPRVKAVVAVAPFANIREEVPPFARNALGPLSSLFGDTSLNKMANALSGVASMDLDSAKPLEEISKTKAKILLIHGDRDNIIPHASSEALQKANAANTELVTIPGKGHLELCFDPLGILQERTRKWYDAHLAK